MEGNKDLKRTRGMKFLVGREKGWSRFRRPERLDRIGILKSQVLGIQYNISSHVYLFENIETALEEMLLMLPGS